MTPESNSPEVLTVTRASTDRPHVKKIGVIGCGYLGAVHAACLAQWGFDTVGLDIDEHKVATLSRGQSPFVEPGLEPLLSKGVASSRLTFSTDPASLEGCDTVFICVNTPQDKSSGRADLSQVRAALEVVTRHMAPGTLVVGKSTVPVGTAAEVATELTPLGFEVAWNPEFLREGTAVNDTLFPDRIVVGALTQVAVDRLEHIYAEPIATGSEFVVTDMATAELTKQAANAFLATKLSFINAVSELCDQTGANVSDLAHAIGLDPRIGGRFLGAGIGFGGGCLPKDLRALAHRSRELGVKRLAEMLDVVDAANQDARNRALDAVLESLDEPVGAPVALLGATFKPNSDDLRDSPAVWLYTALVAAGAKVAWHDPALAGHHIDGVELCSDIATATAGAHVVVVATDWDDYRELDPATLGASQRVVIDVRNCLDAPTWRAAGWTYRGLGR